MKKGLHSVSQITTNSTLITNANTFKFTQSTPDANGTTAGHAD